MGKRTTALEQIVEKQRLLIPELLFAGRSPHVLRQRDAHFLEIEVPTRKRQDPIQFVRVPDSVHLPD